MTSQTFECPDYRLLPLAPVASMAERELGIDLANIRERVEDEVLSAMRSGGMEYAACQRVLRCVLKQQPLPTAESLARQFRVEDPAFLIEHVLVLYRKALLAICKRHRALGVDLYANDRWAEQVMGQYAVGGEEGGEFNG